MTLQATVLEVSVMPSGGQVITNVAVGATVLPLGDVRSFDEKGGTLIVDGLSYSYVSIDTTVDTITLSTPLTVAIDEGEWVRISPASEEKWALVQQSYDGDDMIRARVIHSLADKLPDGIREESARESVLIDMMEGEWTVRDLIALAPQIDVEYLVGDVPPDFTSDNLAPTSSPTPTAIGGVGSIFVTWQAVNNNDPVTYELYGSTTSGFAKNSSTYLGDVSGTSMNVRTLTGGVALQHDTNYYFAVIAKDIDGPAAASAQSNAAQLVKITTDMVAANYVYAGEVFATQIRGGKMSADITVSGSFATADSGQRSIMDGAGFRAYGADGTSVVIDLPNVGMPKFTGIINAFGMTINDGLELRGQANSLAMSSITTLQSTTQGSATSPTLTVDWEQVDSKMTTYLYNLRGYHRETDTALPTFAGNFFGYSRIQHNGKFYLWPSIVGPSGSTRSTRNVVASTMVSVSGNPRYVTLAGHVTSSTETWRLNLYNPATMTADNIAPTELVSIDHGSPDYFRMYAMGRCFSPIGQTTLGSHFALVEYDMYVSPDVFRLRRFACTDTSIIQQGADIVIDAPFVQDGSADEAVRGVVYGSSAKMMFPGADQNIWVIFMKSRALVYNATGTTRLTDLEFETSPDTNSAVATGAVATNTFLRFESTPAYHDTQLNTTRYTNCQWVNTDSPVWWVGYTWADSNTATTGITAETNVSTLASVTMKKRARLTITVPDLPDPAAGYGQPRGVDDVNRFNIYMQKQSTMPARTGLWKQPVQPANLATTHIIETLPTWGGTTNPPIATTFSAQAAAKIQSSAVGDDGLPKFLVDGNGFFHSETLDVSGLGATALQGKAFEQLFYGIRAQARMSGGGQLSVSTAGEVKWSERFLLTAMGKKPTIASDGYFSIYMPPVNTVITGYGGATNKTVNSAGIPLAAWDALWYEIPYGSGGGAFSGNYRITNYTSDFVVPNNWVMICVRNSDGIEKFDFASGPKIGLGGEFYTPMEWTTLTLGNSWVAYGSGFQIPQYKRNADGMVYFRGLMRSGTTGTTITTLAVGTRPQYQKVFSCAANGGTARVDVFPTGVVQVVSYGTGGTNAFVSLDGVVFEVNG